MVRVLIVDDQKFVRDALLSLLAAREPYWELLEAANGHEAVDLVRKITPEVVVLDIVMDGMGGVGAACEIQAIAPETKIVFISTHYTAGEASLITRFLGAGAFVQKAETGRLLIPTIKRLLGVCRR